VQYATKNPGAPPADFICQCAARALADAEGEIVIRIVDETESAMLNERYRGKPGPTNVLAFPAGDIAAPGIGTRLLGDVVICAPVVASEAESQNKPLEAHWAHLVIHGCLHLCGYDHESGAEAREMERRERALLAELGIGDPYRDEA
jgi:probable rRNA maturation factor